MAKAKSTAKVVKSKIQSTPELFGSSVNVPHTEHADPDEKGTVTFDSRGSAKVSKTLAEALVLHYPNQVRLVRI